MLRLFLLVVLILMGVVANPALAAAAGANPATNALDLYYEVTHGFVDTAKRAGAMLLFGLLGIQIAINGIKKLIRPSEMEGLISAVVWPLISTAFFIALIQLSDTFLPRVIQGFEGLGRQAGGGMALTPDEIIFYGIDVAMEMQNAFTEATGTGVMAFVENIFPALFLLFIQIVVVIAHAILGMQMALALISAYFWYCVTPILLGFGGLSYTKDMAFSALKGGIAIGAKLMVIYLIASVTIRMAPVWGALIASVSLDNLKPFWIVGTSVALLAYLAMQVPKLASDLINGQASLTAGDAATNTMMGMAALATAGAGAMATGQAIKQAGAAAAETLGGLVQAGASGLNSASDFGKTGMDAVGHAAKEVMGHGGGIVGGSVRSMLDTSFSNVKAGMDESLGGRVAQSIEAGRGGSISPTGGDGGGASRMSPQEAGQQVDKMIANGSATNPENAQHVSDHLSSMTPESSKSGSPGGSEAGLGDASQVSLSSGTQNGGGSQISNEQLGQQLERLASTMENGNKPSTSDRIRNLTGYVPSDQATVGVSSNLGHGGGEE